MQQSFTPNHLIRFIYKETTAAETLAIGNALEEDKALRERYPALKQGYDQLPKAKFSPSKKALKNILAHSNRTAVEQA